MTYYIAVDVKGDYNESASAITLSWRPARSPIWREQPVDVINIVAGNQLIVRSLALGPPTPTYQWRFNSVNISGATFNLYTNNSVQLSDAGQYNVIASNALGATTSRVCTVVVYTNGTADFRQFMLTNSGLFMHVAGVTSHVYRVESTLDLTNWVTMTNEAASFDYTSAVDTNLFRFFRVVY